jgi:hypothetical protein
VIVRVLVLVGVIVFVLVRTFVRVIVALVTALVDSTVVLIIICSEIGVGVSVFSTPSVWVASFKDNNALCSGVATKGKLKPGIQPINPTSNTKADMPATAIQSHLFMKIFLA